MFHVFGFALSFNKIHGDKTDGISQFHLSGCPTKPTRAANIDEPLEQHKQWRKIFEGELQERAAMCCATQSVVRNFREASMHVSWSSINRCVKQHLVINMLSTVAFARPEGGRGVAGRNQMLALRKKYIA